jgi:hypothetical protein
LFTNIETLTTSNTLAKPDYYWGAEPGDLNDRVREELSKHIVPRQGLPIVPNFSLEAMGPNGSSAVALRQACHNGAIGARAMQSLRSYGQDVPVYENNISAFSGTYHGGDGLLKMYAHSVAQPNGPGTRPEYYMHQLRSFAMTDTADSFRQGATAFKNAMDMTAEFRNAAIARANEIAQTIEEEEDAEEGEDDNGEEDGDYEAEAEEVEDDNVEEDRDYEAEAESSNMMHSFDCSTSQTSQTSQTNQTLGTLDEDEDEDQDKSETSVEEEYRPLPQKRSKPQPAPQRKKRTTGGKEKQSSWLRWLSG